MGVVDHCTEIFSQQPERGLEHRRNTKTEVTLQRSNISLKNKKGITQFVSMAVLWAPIWIHCLCLQKIIVSIINFRSSHMTNKQPGLNRRFWLCFPLLFQSGSYKERAVVLYSTILVLPCITANYHPQIFTTPFPDVV